MFNRKKKISLRKLEESLKKYSDVQLDKSENLELRKRIVAFTKTHEPSEEFGFATLIDKIQRAAAEFKPREYFRVLLREKLITLMEFQRTRKLFNLRWIFTSKRIAASFLAFIFMSVVFFSFTLQVQRVEASTLTTLQEVTGNVSVLRNSEVLPGTPGLLLRADDVIETGSSSSAIIQFLDQSVTRLDQDTEMQISKLFINPANKTETVVEVVLKKGRLWARVVNLIDNFSSFQVKAENAVAVAKRKAAFDVKIMPRGEAKVSAIHNRIDLVVATPNKKVVETSLMKGFSAEVKLTDSAAPKIQSQNNLNENDEWVSSNLEQDRLYIENVKQEAQVQIRDGATVLPGNPLYAVKELSENTKIALTFNDRERQKKIIALARQKLGQAEIFLERGEREKAAPLLTEFQNQIAAVADWLEEDEEERPIEALQLRTEISDILSGYQKQLALMLPHEPLYKLKEAVAQTQILIASGPVEKTQARLTQASEKLQEAHELVENGDSVSAKAQVDEYAKTVNEVLSEVRLLPEDTQDRTVSAILDSKVEDLKVLEAIKNGSSSMLSISQGSTTLQITPGSATPNEISANHTRETERGNISALQRSVSDTRVEALTKFGETVFDAQENKPSVEMLKKLQEIRKIDVNGKPFVDVTMTRNNVLIKTDEDVISITRDRLPQITRPTAPPAATTTPAAPTIAPSATTTSSTAPSVILSPPARSSASTSPADEPAAVEPLGADQSAEAFIIETFIVPVPQVPAQEGNSSRPTINLEIQVLPQVQP